MIFPQVTLEQLKDPTMEQKVAKILAQIHAIPVPENIPRRWELKEGALRCLKELEQDSNLDPRYGRRHAKRPPNGQSRCHTKRKIGASFFWYGTNF